MLKLNPLGQPFPQVQYCQEITYQNPRPRRGYLAFTVRPRAPAGASVLRAPCVRLASTVRLRALAGASTVRAPCVRFASAGEDAAEKEFSS